jgi:hypothetical protein
MGKAQSRQPVATPAVPTLEAKRTLQNLMLT